MQNFHCFRIWGRANRRIQTHGGISNSREEGNMKTKFILSLNTP